MTAYAIAHLRSAPVQDDDIVEYLERIQATLDPFGGRFVVQGGPVEVLEGDDRPGDVVIVEFPDRESARSWYASGAHRAVMRLRSHRITGEVILVEGAEPDHDPAAPAGEPRRAGGGR